ncbi:MAG TPA: hypothetical protein VKB23_11420 [Solirubrobacterales bacterium]|nr:hypothetical protein [Solirubrobacterales bacterium]
MKRVGPELKMPKAQVPPMVRDLFLDLRDRRLLPLLALVVVAIVAVPFLLSEDPEEAAPPPPGGMGIAAGKKDGKAAVLTVAKAAPGLRDYRRRLHRLDPKNPFRQHYTAPVLKGAELSESGSTSSESSSSTSEGGPTDTGSVPAPPSGGTPPAPGETNGKLRLYTVTIKLQISRTEEDAEGNVSMGEPAVREGVRPLTPLPGEKAPVVTYLGANFKTGKALLMVSKEVTATFGEAKCVSGTASCELLEVEPGYPEIFEYGANHVRYKFNVLKIDIVSAGEA